MPRYWIACTTPEKFQVDRGNDFAVEGFREREFRRVLRVEPGDRLVHYIKRLGLFGAIGEVRGRVYIAWNPIWPDDTYPCRFEHRPLLVLPAEKMLPAEAVLPRLGFLNPHHQDPLSRSLRCDLKEIPQEDFEIIEQEMRRRAEGL